MHEDNQPRLQFDPGDQRAEAERPADFAARAAVFPDAGSHGAAFMDIGSAPATTRREAGEYSRRTEFEEPRLQVAAGFSC